MEFINKKLELLSMAVNMLGTNSHSESVALKDNILKQVKEAGYSENGIKALNTCFSKFGYHLNNYFTNRDDENLKHLAYVSIRSIIDVLDFSELALLQS
jgi:hypothetical protein